MHRLLLCGLGFVVVALAAALLIVNQPVGITRPARALPRVSYWCRIADLLGSSISDRRIDVQLGNRSVWLLTIDELVTRQVGEREHHSHDNQIQAEQLAVVIALIEELGSTIECGDQPSRNRGREGKTQSG